MSSVLKGICKMLQIKHLWTLIYHPQTDGLVEQFNGTLKGMIWACIQGTPVSGMKCYSPLLFDIREAPQNSTGYSPFALVYGHQPRRILNLICENWTEPELGRPRWSRTVTAFQERLERVQDRALSNLGKSEAQQKRNYDVHTQE